VSESVFIGLGANLGDREQALGRAVEALTRIDAVAVLRRSSLYESEPVGPPQPRFLNGVVEIDCGLSPQRLLSILKQVERDLGRTPSVRGGPRAIDLDILLWGQRLVADSHLQIPHLELHKRRFALEPLCELAPDLEHPVLKERLSRLLERLSPQGVVRVHSLEWPGNVAEEDAR
jgi:2-amino-4-hydroxy-6-hydroxymethyldihydropteridine diphosphokinase